MSNNENPIHAPVRGGRPLAGDEPRVSRSVSIDSRTNRAVDLNLARLRALEPHASPGHVLDRMAVFCAFHGFDVHEPERKTPGALPRGAGLTLIKDLEQIRDTCVAMADSVRSYPNKHTVITGEGPTRLRDKLNEMLEALRTSRTKKPAPVSTPAPAKPATSGKA